MIVASTHFHSSLLFVRKSGAYGAPLEPLWSPLSGSLRLGSRFQPSLTFASELGAYLSETPEGSRYLGSFPDLDFYGNG